MTERSPSLASLPIPVPDRARTLPLIARLVLPVLVAAVLPLLAGHARGETLRASLTEDYTIAPDRSVSWRTHREYTPLVRSLVEQVSQLTLHVHGNQTLEILDAHTRKANGDIVRVEPGDIVVQNGAVGQAQSYGDLKIHKISFRGVGVGDTVVLEARYTEKEHYIPGHFTRQTGSYPSNFHLDYDLTVHVSAGVPFFYSADSGFRLEQNSADGTRTYRWTAQFDPRAALEKNMVNARDVTPEVNFGTFGSFEELGNVYAGAVADRLRVTPEIGKLASEIAAGKESQRDKAQAIFDWITSHIHYVGIYFGNGGYIPNEPSTIIARGFGDCKDHATIMNVLLAAVGIESQPVLITQEAEYSLPQTAVLSAFNHMIVYIPGLDVFADPTDPTSNLGALPGADAGKPVLLLSPGKSRIRATPQAGTDGNTAAIETRLDLAPDLTLHGTTTTEATGEFAEIMRDFVAAYERDGLDNTVLGMLDSGGHRTHPIEVSIDAPSSLDHRSRYRITVKWKSDGPIELLKEGWLPPPGLTPLTVDRDSFVPLAQDSKRKFPLFCRPGKMTLDTTVKLPSGIKPARILPPVSLVTPLMQYFSGWAHDDGGMTRHVSILSRPPGRVCPPPDANALLEAARAAYNREDIIFRFSREE
ncbi:MAG: DUF3857 domain-containing transglutaminase family protein [Alphaproteobacteria bacterium]|nr:DUF3857 domain-containing transglutaminase family protein [Alphaproteobacteria bacterium]